MSYRRPSRSVVAATATPLQNRVKDVLGYLHLIWKGNDFPSDKDFLELSDAEFKARYRNYNCPRSIRYSVDYRDSQVLVPAAVAPKSPATGKVRISLSLG
jgi:hypothetical protein